MARTPESAEVDFAESSLFTGRFSILALAACGVGFGLSGRLPAAIFSLAAAAVAAAAGIEPGSDYDGDQIWGDDEDIRALKSLVLFGLRGTAAYAYHARVLGYRAETDDEFFDADQAPLAEPGSLAALLPL